MREYELLSRVDGDHSDMGKQWELAMHLVSRERLEQAIPVLLNIVAVDRNY